MALVCGWRLRQHGERSGRSYLVWALIITWICVTTVYAYAGFKGGSNPTLGLLVFAWLGVVTCLLNIALLTYIHANLLRLYAGREALEDSRAETETLNKELEQRILSRTGALRDAALALDEARSHSETNATKLRNEITKAATVQSGCSSLNSEGSPYQTAMFSRAGNIISGDFAQFKPQGADHYLGLVGDAMGHDTSSAMATIIASSTLTQLQRLRQPHEVLGIIDNSLIKHQSEAFVTALAVTLDAKGSAEIACAGHPPPLLQTAGEITPTAVVANAPLGSELYAGNATSNTSAKLNTGDILWLYSDGFLDLPTGNGGRLGMEGFRNLIRPLGQKIQNGKSVEKVVATVENAVADFLGQDASLVDDLTLMAIYYPNAES